MSKIYTPCPYYNCIDDYISPDGYWELCPRCKLRPKIWVFDNGRSTACGCWENKYDHFSITAKSIMDAYERGERYDENELRKNWNDWCKQNE